MSRKHGIGVMSRRQRNAYEFMQVALRNALADLQAWPMADRNTIEQIQRALAQSEDSK